ncbi:MAG: TIGR03364 family FAD-dependent oxidoreductase [Bacteroidia bacterium]|nr:TIGR03364 family FAD-dependent oxidoreductase [Bacteroidia bacterium]
MSEKTYDLLIVGGGILGTFHAYHALSKGLKVALLEKDARPRGATVRNFGQIVPSGMDAKWQGYGRRSLEIYKSIQAKFDITLRQNGSIYLASDEEEMNLLHELSEINEKHNYASEVWDAQKCLHNYEGLRKDYCMGGLFYPEEVTLEPETAIHRILDYLVEQKNLDYFPLHAVNGVEIKGQICQILSIQGKSFQADKVILCSGAEFHLLFPEIFRESDMEWVKLQMLKTFPQKQQVIQGSILSGLSIRRYESFRECPSYAQIKSKEDPESFARKWGVHILFKQATDGSVILGDSHEYALATEAGKLDYMLKEEINNFIIEESKKIFDLETYEIAHTWYGIYTQCKHKDIFQYTIEDKIHIVTGIGGKGMTGSAGFAEEHLEKVLGL